MAASRKQSVKVAFCAPPGEDLEPLRALAKARGWSDSGSLYQPEQWRELVRDAKRRKFTTVCASVGGLHWLAEVVPVPKPARPQPEPRSEVATEPVPAIYAVVAERTRELTGDERAASTEAIAQSLLRDGLATGSLADIKKTVRQALLSTGAFCVTNSETNEEPLWRPWKATSTSEAHPSGGRLIQTQVLSSTGVPCTVSMLTKPLTPELLREVVDMLDATVARKKETPQGTAAEPPSVPSKTTTVTDPSSSRKGRP